MVLLGIGLSLATRAASAQSGPDLPRSRYVDLDSPANWPSGEWVPLPRAAWERFLESWQAASDAVEPPEAFVWKRVFQARLEGNTLRGVCQFDIRPRGNSAGEVLLDPLGIYLSQLRWPAREAVWGARADGRTIVWAEPGDTTLTGTWELQGEYVGQTLEFNCEFPRSAISELQLDLPQELTVTSSAGIVSPPLTLPGGDMRRWTVQTGRRSTFKLQCFSSPASGPSVPVPVACAFSLTAHGEGVDAQYDFELEEAGESRLTLVVPRGLEVLSATLGVETPLPTRIRQVDGSQHVTIDLSDTRLVPGSRVRLRGFQPLDWRSEQVLPVPRLPGRAILDQQLAFHIRPPYRLNDFRADGYRLTDRRTDSDRVETWLYQALRSDPELSVSVAAPSPELQCSAVTWLDFTPSTPRMLTRLRIRGGGGGTFRILADVSPEWDVISVAPFRQEAGGTGPNFYVTPPDGSGASLVTMEFRQAIDPGAELDLVLTALGPNRRPGTPVPIPLVRVHETAQSDGVCAVRAPTGLDVSSNFAVSSLQLSAERLKWLQELLPGAEAALTFDQRDVASAGSDATLSFESSSPIRAAEEEPGTLPAEAARGSLGEPPAAGTAASTASPDGAAPRTTATTGAPSRRTTATGASSQLLPSRPLPAATIELRTRLAPAGVGHHRHEAHLPLLASLTGVCEFQLDRSATAIELEIDGTPVELVRVANLCRTRGPVNVRRSATIRYRSPASEGTSPVEVIPVPVFAGVQPRLEWRIEPTSTRACASIDIPFGRVVQRASIPAAVRFLGPLARVSGRSAAEVPPPADEPAPPGADPAGESSGGQLRGILEVEAPSVPPTVRLRTWNPALIDGAAWATLAFVLLVTVTVRRWRLPWLNRWAPLWVSSVVLAAWLASEALSPILGGCLIATLLGLTLPRRIVVARHPRRVAARRTSTDTSSRQARVTVGGATSSAVLLAVVGSLAWSDDRPTASTAGTAPAAAAPSDPATPVEVLLPLRGGEPLPTVYVRPDWAGRWQTWNQRREQSPGALIRHADYDVEAGSPHRVTARFEILAPPSAEPTLVRLPLGNMTFDTATSVLIDGEEATIIPTRSGDGFFVQFDPAGDIPAENGPSVLFGPPGPEAAPRAPPAATWRVHTITAIGATPANPRPDVALELKVPPVASAEVHLLSSVDPQHRIVLRGRGGRRTDPQNELRSTSYVGAQSLLRGESEASADHSSAAPTVELVGTLIDVFPLKLSAKSEMTLLPGGTGGGRVWTIPLAPGVAVTEVRGLTEQDWSLVRSGEATFLQIRVLRATSTPLPIQVHLVRGIDATQDPAHCVHVRRLIGLPGRTGEWIVMRPAAGFQLEVLQDAASTAVVPAALSDLPESLRLPVADDQVLACRLTSEQSVPVRLKPLATELTASWDGMIEVQRTSATWNATVQVDVSGAPTAIYELHVDPQVQLELASVNQDGADRLARFRRVGERLQLVLSSPLSGPQSIVLRGSFPVTPGQVVRLPEASLTAASAETFAWTISNQSGWSLEPLTSLSAATDAAPDQPGEASPASDVPASTQGLITFRGEDPAHPIGFRLHPGPDAASVECVTTITLDRDSGWLQRTFGLMRPEGAPLNNVEFVVPAGWGRLVSVTPAADVLETTRLADGSHRVAMRPARLRNGLYRFVIESRLPVPADVSLWDLPRITFTMARQRSHALLLDSRFPYRLTSASVDDAPLDRSVWRMLTIPRSNRMLPFRVARSGPAWVWTRYDVAAPATSVPLLETMVWRDARDGARGTTAITCITTQPDKLTLQIPTAVRVEGVSLAGAPQDFSLTDGRLEIPVPPEHQGAPLIVHWRADIGSGISADVLSIPAPQGWTPDTHVAACVEVGDRVWHRSTARTATDWQCARMAGLLSAIERQSTRAFALDSPLLVEVRAADAALEQGLAEGDLTADEAAEVRSLRERWRRIHPLIAVRAEEPGADVHASGAAAMSAWSGIDWGPDLQTYVLGPHDRTLTLPHENGMAGVVALGAIFLGLSMLLLLLQRSRLSERVADWLGARPAMACLLLGSAWALWLAPTVVGYVILAAGLTLLSRRQSGSSWTLDTALVGPGK